jgi:uncharacterized RmlC-like cupin family protein
MRKLNSKKRRVFLMGTWLVALSAVLISCLQIVSVSAPSEIHPNDVFEVTMVLDDRGDGNNSMAGANNCWGYLGVQLPDGWTINANELSYEYYAKDDPNTPHHIGTFVDDEAYIKNCFTKEPLETDYHFVGFGTIQKEQEVMDRIVIKMKVHTDGQAGNKFLKLYVQENGDINGARPEFPRPDPDETHPDGGDAKGPITENCVYTVNIKVIPKATIVSAGAGATASDYHKVGESVNIDAGTAPTGKRFKQWSADPSVVFGNAGASPTTFTMPASDVTVTAEFEDIPYTLTMKSAGNGNAGSSGGIFHYNNTVSISVGAADSYYGFSHWTANPSVNFANNKSENTTFPMPAENVEVTANFGLLRMVTITSEGEGATASANSVAGHTVTISAGTKANHRFAQWTADPDEITFDSQSPTTSFVMIDKPVTVTARFVPVFAVTVVSEGDSPSAGGNYAEGDKVPINAGTPPIGKHFVNWTTNDGVHFDKAESASTFFSMPDKPVTVTANFDWTPYAVTVESIANDATGSNNYTYGKTVTINAGTTPSGYRFVNWTAEPEVTFEGETATTATFSMPASAVTVTANYIRIYEVTIDSPGATTGAGEYAQRETVSISTTTPSKYHRFVNWTAEPEVDFSDAEQSPTSFTMPATTVAVIANFIALYDVTIVSDAIDASGDGEYSEGETVDINAGTTPSGYRFTHWSADPEEVDFANPKSAVTSFPMLNTSVEVTAHFGQLYEAMVVSDGSGATGSGMYLESETVSIKAGKAPAGFRFTHWTADPGTVDFIDATAINTTFAMLAESVTVTAVFEPVYKLTVASLGAGAKGSGEYLEAEKVAIDAGADPNYRFMRWVSTPKVTFAKATAVATTFPMLPQEVTVTAEFERLYAVRVATVANGKVSIDNTPAIAGETVTLRIAPDNGYALDAIDIRLTGSPQTPVALLGEGSTRTLVMPAGAVTITATFKKTPDRLSLDDAIGRIESASFVLDQEVINTQEAAFEWLVDTLNQVVEGTGVVVPERNVWMYNFTAAVAGTKDRPAGRDGSFAASVSLSKNGVYATIYAYGTITATAYVPVGIDTPQTGSLNVYVQNGTLRVSGLTAGESWSVYNVSGRLVHGQIAAGGEANVSLAVHGVYIVRAGNRALKVVY